MWKAALALLAVGDAAVEEFTVYTEPLHIKRGNVHNSPIKAKLPASVVSRYAGKTMGVVSFQLDIVSKGEGGAERRLPLSEIYNHHTIQLMSTQPMVDAVYKTWSRADPLGPTAPHCGKVDIEKDSRWGGYQDTIPQFWYGPIGGAEYRDADRDLPGPYRQFVDSPEAFVAILHFINAKVPSQPKPPFECPCVSDRVFNYTNGTIDGVKPLPFACDAEFAATGNGDCFLKGYPGGYRCCTNGAWVVEPQFRGLGEDVVYGKFTFRVDSVTPESKQVVHITVDVTGANAEYDLPKCTEPEPSKCVHVVERVLPITAFVPVQNPGIPAPGSKLELLTLRGHQHVAGLGSEVWNHRTGELICRTLPRYGQGAGEIDAPGFVVGIPPCVWGGNASIPTLGAEDWVRIVSHYNNTEHHMGVMGLFFIQAHITKYLAEPVVV